MLFQIFWLRVSQGQIDYPLTQKMLNLLLQFAPKKHLWNPEKRVNILPKFLKYFHHIIL